MQTSDINNSIKKTKKINSKKIIKGILISIPIFFVIMGTLIISLAGWNLVKQTFFLTKTLITDYPVRPYKKFTGLYEKRPEIGDVIGEIIIPTISLDYPLIHGTEDEQLKKGVGHYAASTLPGENGNFIVSAHRDTHFRNLGQVKIGDLIIVKNQHGNFTYKAAGIRIVEADDRTVIVPSEKEMMTLTTCYPFYYIGSAPKRYILTADFVKREPLNKQENVKSFKEIKKL